MRICLIPSLMILSLSSCAYIEKQIGLEEDNFLEEVVEEIIELEFHIPVDLTPGSKE